MKNRILTIFLPLLLFGCGYSKEFKTTKDDSIKYISVDIEQVIANPSRFDGKYIETSGIFIYEFENVAIYKSRMGSYRRDKKNAFWTRFEDNLMPEGELEKINNKRIVVRGLINSKSMGHLMQFAGTLEKVDFIKY